MAEAMNLAWADAATRRLDRERTRHHLALHELEGAATHWFNIQPMNARTISTAAIIWLDPEQALAQFDSIVSDGEFEGNPDTPWGPLLMRSRAELLVNVGALSKAGSLVDQLLAHGDASVSAVPAARLEFLRLRPHGRQGERGDLLPTTLPGRPRTPVSPSRGFRRALRQHRQR